MSSVSSCIKQSAGRQPLPSRRSSNTSAWCASSISLSRTQSPLKTCDTGWEWTPLKRQSKHVAFSDYNMSAVRHPALFQEQHNCQHLRGRGAEGDRRRHGGRPPKETEDTFPKQQQTEPDGGVPCCHFICEGAEKTAQIKDEWIQ